MLPGLDDRVDVVVPTGTDPAVVRLLRAELTEVGTALGVPVRLVDDPTPGHPRWTVDTGWTGTPDLSWDPTEQLLRTRGPLVDGLQLLHALVRRGGGRVAAPPLRDARDVVQRVREEVGGSYPGFGLRGLDWDELCARHAPAVEAATDPLPALQRWVAELADVHTAVRPTGPRHHPPYAARAGGDGDVVLVRVPVGTPAHDAGVRAGWRLDGAPPDVLARTGAPGHVRPLLAGRRALEQHEPERPRAATAPDGRRVRWTERVVPLTAGSSVDARRLDRDTGYLRLRGFVPGTAEAVGAVLADLRGARRLVVDLRGNTGGMLVEATAVRDRFLREPTTLGGIAHTDGAGRLGPRFALLGRPHADRWAGEVVAVTDGLTASAAEDLLLGLQGLPHVRVVGEPSAGGSGRPRVLPLTADTLLSVSTALTYDRTGRCVEGAGIPVDVPHPTGTDEIVEVARRL